jgi:glycolate oxidase subunit GlcD
MDQSSNPVELAGELARLVGEDAVLTAGMGAYATDSTEGRGLRGWPDAVVMPEDAGAVAQVVAWCYHHGVPMVPRGGGTGFAGGAVPVDGGVVISLERLRRVRAFDPLLWRANVEAGLTTAEVQRLARESGLDFPPNPGAAEQSQIGGNIATNAGGPRSFKYGATGEWVTGLEAVVAPGELISVGGPARRDVAGYDLKRLLVGSEGTLGIVTAAWLRLLPAPAARLPVVALHPDADSGCAALERVLGSGIRAASLEFLDEATIALAGGAFPADAAVSGFMTLAEADGSPEEVLRLRAELEEALGEGATRVLAPTDPNEVARIVTWRDGVSLIVSAQHGGKLSEDVAVPLDRLAEALAEVKSIAAVHGLETCAWGHAGDGIIHASFLVDRTDERQLDRAGEAAADLFALALRLGGTVTGEHGIGVAKAGQLQAQWPARAVELHEQVKRVFDPKNLFNPGKKLARPSL